MTTLRLCDEQGTELALLTERADIAATLAEQGIDYQYLPTRPLADLSPGAVLECYQDAIAQWQQQGGYQSVDVVSLQPDNPNAAELRKKFLDEHIHAEDEVRFFAAGSGIFYLHLGDRVHALTCTQGDYLSVPAGTRHWFDMGREPYFVAVRLFTNPDGWVAQHTGDKVAANFIAA
ncbi:cupin [Gallaecimonas kandeliae]|uniref:1,2-dihydroxy-3-keto-5-methylthiopentene dioxygenase n=1 Tax=Gallaecimonas kandeliae TaxID=3029055 RepID=UPI0026472BAD|nr:cupin [Gallaecimonas kandeliae]WKE64136.1 cupin [Gallaecimonas kandeliae]